MISMAHAQELATDTATDLAVIPQGPGLVGNLLFIAILFAIFYLLMIRPQQKRMKAHQNMLSELGKGSKIVTQGGLIGVIDKIQNDNEVTIKVDDVKMTVLRSAIMARFDDAVPQKAANDTKPAKGKKKKA